MAQFIPGKIEFSRVGSPFSNINRWPTLSLSPTSAGEFDRRECDLDRGGEGDSLSGDDAWYSDWKDVDIKKEEERDTTDPFSKAWLQHAQTVSLSCMWFMEEPSQLSMGQMAETNLFHHGETTYRGLLHKIVRFETNLPVGTFWGGWYVSQKGETCILPVKRTYR